MPAATSKPRDAAVTKPNEAAQVQKASGRTLRVMTVDDHPLMRDGLKRMVESESDMELIAESSSAPEALRALKRGRPDVLIIDLTLEGMGGLELLKQIREMYGDIPALVLSMHDENVYAERALRAGARGYIMKREGAQNLIAAIRTVSRGGVWVSSAMSDKMLGRFVGGNSDTAANPLARLSDRELEVYQLIGQGLKTRQIAEQLCVSVKTIESHREHIKQKLRLRSGAELVQHATCSALHPEETPKA